ncbi:glutathione S-transferase [Sphingomonas sp.]|uniref:glutathione S-transferase n=1 Tax=Sphingomonas sp. TaxID=28214 RepID=UPI0018598D5A|nr:glutathione S-transferase [Sphingomonas sp.]MBA3512464.1 glutathione S-transferase [Sphingomonas sp.]
MTDDLRIVLCVNRTCPWSGKPVSSDSLTMYRGKVVGFCNPGCREKFEAATGAFDALIDGPR